MKLLRIYDADTGEVVMEVEGSTNEECESAADDAGYDLDLYGWTYCDEVRPGYVAIT